MLTVWWSWVGSRTIPIVFVEEKKSLESAGNQTPNHSAIIWVTIRIPNKINIKFYLDLPHKVAVLIKQVSKFMCCHSENETLNRQV